MRKHAAALLLALLAGCVTPDPHRDLREPDPVEAAEPDPIIAFVAELIYLLGSWLGPKT